MKPCPGNGLKTLGPGSYRVKPTKAGSRALHQICCAIRGSVSYSQGTPANAFIAGAGKTFLT
jgi:hypothetical protein